MRLRYVTAILPSHSYWVTRTIKKEAEEIVFIKALYKSLPSSIFNKANKIIVSIKVLNTKSGNKVDEYKDNNINISGAIRVVKLSV
jgi:hypothetical protein